MGPPPAEPAPSIYYEEHVPEDFARYVLDTGRADVLPAEEGVLRVQIHGEYELRYEHVSSVQMEPTASLVGRVPGAVADSTGQNDFVSHWLRVTPRMTIGENLELVGQMDVLTGLVLGDQAHDTSADATPRDDYDGFSNVQPRWLYLDYKTPVGLLRVGQQPNHWGMGILANDGDHPSLFGDYRYGNIVEQVLFGTKPLGKDSPFVVAIAGNLVFKDNFALLSRGDHAYQGILAAFYEKGPNMAGLYGVWRHQETDRVSGSSLFPFAETIDAGIVDLAGHFAAPVLEPSTHAWVYGAAEGALILGTTNELVTPAQVLGGQTTDLRSYGGAAQLGFVLAGSDDDGNKDGARPERYGRVVAQLELGYASGDADPYSGTLKRFTFDPNHKVGLLLFDEVMRFQTARAATAAQDPLLQNGGRPTPGVDLLPSNGGVFGAEYVYPTAVFRPRRWLDLKGGMVLAQTTADLVDPYRVAATSQGYVNYRGGDSQHHDLGIELDGGAEARLALDFRMTLQLGAQAGVLFPGQALADANGVTPKTPWIAIGRAGVEF
jgi:hypothetical protein